MPAERVDDALSDKVFDRVEALDAFARDHGHTLLELAIAWLLARPTVASVIAGATKPEQAQANAAAAGWTLTDDDLPRDRRPDRRRKGALGTRRVGGQNIPASRPAATVAPSSWQRSRSAGPQVADDHDGRDHELPAQAGDDALDAADRAVAVGAGLHEQRVGQARASRRAAGSTRARRSL